MFLVMGITGKVGGATAEHLLAHGKEVRALVRNREKASSWANRGVELVDGDWNDSVAIGRALKGVEGAFVVIALVADGTIQLFAPAQIASMLQETGFAMDLTRVSGPIILACAILYAIPATAVLGAILVTGFLGGAICAHVRIGELGSPPEIISLLLGAMTWVGLYARDPRVRAILPFIR